MVLCTVVRFAMALGDVLLPIMPANAGPVKAKTNAAAQPKRDSGVIIFIRLLLVGGEIVACKFHAKYFFVIKINGLALPACFK